MKIWSQKWNVNNEIPNNEIWHSEQVKFVNHKYDIWNGESWPEIKNLGRFGLKIAMHLIFMKFGTQNKCNMLIMNWNWWSWPKITDLGKFVPNTEIYSEFYEIWHSQQIEHTYYEYNTHQYLKRSHDYRLRIIIGSEHGTIIV